MPDRRHRPDEPEPIPDLPELVGRRVAAALGGDAAVLRATLAEAARFAREAEAARPALGPGDSPVLHRVGR